MPDLGPATLRHVLALRQFPIFAGVAIDELATMAENLVSVRYPAGTVIAQRRARPALELIVTGRIAAGGSSWGPRQVFGALEIAAGRELAETAVAAEDTTTLQLSATDFGEVLEDNFGVLVSALRELSVGMLRLAPPDVQLPSSFVAGRLGLVERLIVLRNQLPFRTARLQALATLAHASDDVTWPADTTIVRAGELAAYGLVVVEGTLRVRDEAGATRIVEAGAATGWLETLAGVRHRDTIETLSPVRALRSSGTAILDVLEDHTDVGLAMITAFAGVLLDASSAN
jgi:CRP-like cAMP-binding protein